MNIEETKLVEDFGTFIEKTGSIMEK